MNHKTSTFPAICAAPLSRRHVLAGTAGALVAAGLGTWSGRAGAAEAKPLPPYAAWKDPNSLIVHSSSTLETKRSAMGMSVITPSERLYVRNNLPAPDASILADREGWQIAIEGVKSPRALTVRELKALGIETLATVLQCSGNGRGFFPSKPSGTPWTVGAAGCVMWTGVPVEDGCAGARRRDRRHAAHHRHRRREAARGHRSEEHRGRAFGADQGARRRDAGLGDERHAAVAGAWRAAAPDRAGLPGRQQHQVRQAPGLHRRRDRRQDHDARLPHHAAGGQGRSEPGLGAGNERQVVDQLAHPR